MLQLVQVKPLSGYRLWLEYSDGVRGEVDLTDLAGQGAFKVLQQPDYFEKAHIDRFGDVAWEENIQWGQYSLYRRITGKTPDDMEADEAMAHMVADFIFDETMYQMDEAVRVEARPEFRIWIEFKDGMSGEIDLSRFVGKGIFKAWDEPGFFEKVHIDANGAIAWDAWCSMSPDALYSDLTGKPIKMPQMLEPVKVEARPGYRIWVEFNDGVSGELDLTEYVGKPVFKVWDEPGYFEKVHVSAHRTVAWDDDLEFCTESMYMDITGKSWDELPEHVASIDSSE